MANRTLTDEDLDHLADKLADKVAERMEIKFLLNVGKGFMKYVWAGIFSILLYLAATGYKGH